MTRVLLFLVAACCWCGFVAAQPVAPPVAGPMPMVSSSPVDLFRRLLATNSAGRELWLASKPATTRKYVEAKLREYEMMPAAQREARLRALRLRYLMQMNPVDRASRLATLPEPERSLLSQQLRPWDILPPQLKKDVLENENVIRMVVAAGSTNQVESNLPTMTKDQREELERQHERWNQLPADRKEQILARFSQFFEMRDAEKSRVVAKLGEEDRAQMEKTLSRFGSLSREEREQAMQGFKKFAELSPAEQASFLRTADRWKAMSEGDKELWRKVVASFQATRQAPIPTVGKPLGERPALSATN
jgi:hypothetical protein